MQKQGRMDKILGEYRKRLREALGEELEGLVLFGSQARNDSREGSDVDVLCVMKSPFDYSRLIEQTSAATAELSLKYDIVLSRAFVESDEYKSRGTPFLMNVRREGVAL